MTLAAQKQEPFAVPARPGDGLPVRLSEQAEISVPRAANDPAPARLGWLIFWMTGTLLSFLIAAVSVRALSKSLTAFEIMSIRSAGGLVILLSLAIARPDLLRGFRARRMRLQAARSVVHFVSQICWTIAIIAAAIRHRVRARIHHRRPGSRCSQCCSSASG